MDIDDPKNAAKVKTSPYSSQPIIPKPKPLDKPYVGPLAKMLGWDKEEETPADVVASASPELGSKITGLTPSQGDYTHPLPAKTPSATSKPTVAKVETPRVSEAAPEAPSGAQGAPALAAVDLPKPSAPKADDWLSNLASFLGEQGKNALSNLGTFASRIPEAVSRGASAAGGTIESNPYYVANKQAFEKAQLQAQIQQALELQKREQEYNVGRLLPEQFKNASALQAQEQDYNVGQLLPAQTEQAMRLYGGNLATYLKEFPYLGQFYKSMADKFGAGGYGLGGVNTTSGALAQQLRSDPNAYSQLLNTDTLKNLQYDPARDQAYQQWVTGQMLGMMPSPPSR